MVATSVDERRTLLGEAWFTRKPPITSVLHAETKRLRARRPPPSLRGDPVYVLYVPRVTTGTPRVLDGVHIITLADLR